MRIDYPYFVNDIQQILRWFDGVMRDRTGNKIPPSKYGYLGGRLKKFMNENNLSVDEMKTLIWGVMNDKGNMYSPVYAFYFLDKLKDYQALRNEMEKRKESEEDNEVEFDKESLDNEREKEEIGDDFFGDL